MKMVLSGTKKKSDNKAPLLSTIMMTSFGGDNECGFWILSWEDTVYMEGFIPLNCLPQTIKGIEG